MKNTKDKIMKNTTAAPAVEIEVKALAEALNKAVAKKHGQNPANIRISILKKYMRVVEVLSTVQVDPKASAEATTSQTTRRNKIVTDVKGIIAELTGTSTSNEVATSDAEGK